MITRSYLFSDLFQILKAFHNKFPNLTKLARESSNIESFKDKLNKYLAEVEKEDPSKKPYINKILTLIEYDSKTVSELSTGEQLGLNTISYLWSFLCGKPVMGTTPDFLLDLYNIFSLLKDAVKFNEKKNISGSMEKWPSGLNREVIHIRAENKRRIINLLIDRIEKKDKSAKFHFEDNLTTQQKFEQVEKWWNLSQFHLAMAIKDPILLNNYLNNSLNGETMSLLIKAKKKGVPFFITPYYASLLNVGEDGYDDLAIRTYIIYSEGLVNTYGTIKAWEKEDIIVPGEPNAAGWVLPDGGNIHRRYPEVAILIPDSMGRACGGICASCQSM